LIIGVATGMALATTFLWAVGLIHVGSSPAQHVRLTPGGSEPFADLIPRAPSNSSTTRVRLIPVEGDPYGRLGQTVATSQQPSTQRQ
jgi:hypothetical protein